MIPERLRWLEAGHPDGPAWLASLPDVVDRCRDKWALVLGEPYAGSFVSLALRARAPEYGEVVVKIQLPHRESEHEAEALRRWRGDGAVRLLDEDVDLHALLLERCTPGTPLVDRDAEESLDVFTDLLPRLWKPARAPFRPLAEEAAWWIGDLESTWERAGRPFERTLLDAAVEQLHELSSSQPEHEQVLLHQDLHTENVLAAEREPWLVIDPKPLVGERAFAVAPIVRDYGLGHSRQHVAHRLDRLTRDLRLDADRAWGWALGQTVAWSFEGEGALGRHLDTARWLLDLR